MVSTEEELLAERCLIRLSEMKRRSIPVWVFLG
jgi:hypothetical protein